MSNKKIWVLSTVGAVGLTYAIVGSNAFADTSVTPVPTVTAPAIATTPSTVTTPITPPVAPSIDPSPLSTLPSAGNSQDDGDGQVGDQTDDVNQSGDNKDGAVTNGDESDPTLVATASIDLNQTNQSDDNQGESDSND